MAFTLTDEEKRLLVRPLTALSKTPPRQSGLMRYLPAVYGESEMMGRFLCIFEDTIKPLQHQVSNLAYYFNPLVTPPELLDWLATWVNLVLDESWPQEQRRRLIRSATELYSWRGTKKGIEEYLRLYTGVEPFVSEYVDGMRLGPETFLGVNTMIAGREPHSFTVTLQFEGLDNEELGRREIAIRRIIEVEKPAHTTYRLVMQNQLPISHFPTPAPDSSRNPDGDPGTDSIIMIKREDGEGGVSAGPNEAGENAQPE